MYKNETSMRNTRLCLLKYWSVGYWLNQSACVPPANICAPPLLIKPKHRRIVAYNFAVDVSLSMSNSTVRLRACAALVIDQILSANMCKLQIQAAHLLLRAKNHTWGGCHRCHRPFWLFLTQPRAQRFASFVILTIGHSKLAQLILFRFGDVFVV